MELPSYSITKLQNQPDCRTSAHQATGIQLHSSQNNNVVLFFVVHPASRDETNLFITNNLQADFQISTACPVEMCENPGGPSFNVSAESELVIGAQFTTQNG